ncbi:MAG: alpha-galactosidase [Clostridia bacterium]|nr:alpha-galactosidase [Clostridia bacterium]
MIRNFTNTESDRKYSAMISNPALIPLSFTYGGKRYEGFGGEDFTYASKKTEEKDGIICTSLELLLKGTLKITLTLNHYPSHGATDITMEAENISDGSSEIIEDICFSLKLGGEQPILKGILGDHENFYKPYEYDLTTESVNFTSDSGRATHVYFPYFNFENSNGGYLLAIGWAGTWTADFVYENGVTEYRAKSVNNLCTYLKAGEKIRTARFAFIEYCSENKIYATNIWRSWYVSYILPKADAEGNPMKPFSTCCLDSDTGLPRSDGSISERYFTWRPSLEKMIAEDAKVDFRWFDAGWYITPDKKSCIPRGGDRDWWGTVGTWELDPNKWPNDTFLESTDFARANGMKTLVWFEPERVTDVENLARNFGYNTDWAISMEETNVISNNIGNPDCFDWITDRICNMLRHNKVEMYREDNNGDPARLWGHMDKKEGDGRSGITECKFIDAHYRMWDKFIECTLGHGGCGFVDSCASGGGRNDLESMRRGIPLLRSDHDRMSTGIRLSQTSSFNKWIPFCGANTKAKKYELDATGDSDTYIWRASYLAALNVDSQFVQDPDQDFGVLREGLREWKEINGYLLKEFYTFTPWHHEDDLDGFTAYSYFDSEAEKGVLFVFRQENCEESEIALNFGYTNGRELVLCDKDTDEKFETAGCRLTLNLPAKRTAKLYYYTLK